MTQQKKKTPAKQEVYCVVAHVKTSAGRIFHGDRAKLPKAEAEENIAFLRQMLSEQGAWNLLKNTENAEATNTN